MGYSRACKEKSTTTLPRVISLAGSAAFPGQPAAHAYSDGLTRAYAACERLAREHYENFPVASRLLPRRMNGSMLRCICGVRLSARRSAA